MRRFEEWVFVDDFENAACIPDAAERSFSSPCALWPVAAFAAAIHHSSGGIVITDARQHDNPIIFINPAFSEMSGYASGECVGRNCRFLQGDVADREVVAQMRTAISDAQPFRGRLLNRHASGASWWNDVQINPIFDERGELIYFVGLQRDVTRDVQAENALRDSEQRYRVLCDNSSDIIARHAPGGIFLDVSSACRDLLGYEPRELIGHSLYDLFHADDLRAVQKVHNRVLDGKKMHAIAYRMRHADGSFRWVETTLRLLRDKTDASLEIVTVTRDIRERRRGEEARQHESEQQLSREQNARSQAENAVERLQALQNITDIALFNLDSDETLREFMCRIRGALHCDAASLLLLDEENQTLHLRACDGLPGENEPLIIPVGEGVIGRIASTRSSIVVADLAQIDSGNLFVSPPMRALMGVPLMVDRRLIGVLHVGSAQQNQFTNNELQLLQLVADRAATAMERGRLFEQVRVGNEQLHALSRRLLDVQENERRHIARELHDEIGQLLTAVKINLQNAQNVAAQQNADSRRNQQAGDFAGSSAPSSAPSSTRCVENNFVGQVLGECVEIAEQAIQQVRQMSVALRPPVLDVLGLVAALREASDRVAQRSGFAVHVSADALLNRLPADVETACFRVAQEALTNIARHARASQVEVTLRVRLGMLHLLVCDDGVGFDVEMAVIRARNGESLGLIGMEERVLLTGGQFKILSRPNQGTQLRASFAIVE